MVGARNRPWADSIASTGQWPSPVGTAECLKLNPMLRHPSAQRCEGSGCACLPPNRRLLVQAAHSRPARTGGSRVVRKRHLPIHKHVQTSCARRRRAMRVPHSPQALPPMPPRDLVLVLLIVVAWAGNFLTSALALREIPPFLFTALRFALLALPLALLVKRPAPGQWPRLLGGVPVHRRAAFRPEFPRAEDGGRPVVAGDRACRATCR